MGHGPLEHPRVSAIDRTIEAALFRLGLAVLVFEFGQREFALLTRFRKMRIIRRGGAFLSRFSLAFDQARRQHRRQGERNQQRNRDCERRSEAERRHEPAHDSGHKAYGQEDRQQRKCGRRDRQTNLARAFDGRLKWRHSFFFDEAENVFQHHDRVVDHDSNHQRQRQHRDLVQRKSHRRHQSERRDDRCRNRNGRDECRPEVPEEDEDDDGRQDAAFDQVQLNRMQRGLDEDRLVADDLSLDVAGQGWRNLRQPFFHIIGDGHGVLSGLFGNDQRHGRLSVQTRFGALLFRAVFDIANVAQLNGIGSAIGHHQIIKLRRVGNPSHRAHRQLALAFFDATAGHFHVLHAYRGGHVDRRNIERAHLVRIDPDFHFALPATDDLDVADAVNRFDQPLDLLVRDVGHFAQRAGRGNGDAQNRCRIGVELLDDGNFGRLRKIVDDEIDFVAHFLRRHVSVLFQDEGDEDLRDALDRSRTQLVDSADGIDRAFDLVGDFGFNLLRRRAGIDYGHGNRRQIDLRKQIDAQ